MLKKLLLIVIFIGTSVVYADDINLRSYDEYQIPKGYYIPIMSMQEFSTAYTEENEKLYFVTTNDIYLYDKNVLPHGTRITGYVIKKNEPVRGTNGSMVVVMNKMYLADGYEIPIKGYISTANGNLIGGELTLPEVYQRVPHYQRWSMFRTLGICQLVPGEQRRMGEHTTVSSGANLIMVIAEPINMTHGVIK